MFQVVVEVCGIVSVLILIFLSPWHWMRGDDNRCNKYTIKKLTHCGARNPQQISKFPKPFPAQVAQLLAVGLLDRFIQLAQNLESVRLDLRHNHPTVLCFPPARDQTTFFQPVQQSGDVGVSRNHAARYLAAGQAVRRPAQDAEHVVLRRRKVLGLEKQGQAPRQHVRSAQQVEECSFLSTGRAPPFVSGLSLFSFHCNRILFVITTIVKTLLPDPPARNLLVSEVVTQAHLDSVKLRILDTHIGVRDVRPPAPNVERLSSCRGHGNSAAAPRCEVEVCGVSRGEVRVGAYRAPGQFDVGRDTTGMQAGIPPQNDRFKTATVIWLWLELPKEGNQAESVFEAAAPPAAANLTSELFAYDNSCGQNLGFGKRVGVLFTCLPSHPDAEIPTAMLCSGSLVLGMNWTDSKKQQEKRSY